MDFTSDTAAPAHPQILKALETANSGYVPSYGMDDLNKALQKRLAEIFGVDLSVWLTYSGSSANALALSVLCPPTGSVICHKDAHIERDERGAVEFFTHGGKLALLEGEGGKISYQALQAKLSQIDRNFVHETPPHALSLSNLTEADTCYTTEDIETISKLTKAYNLHIHMDGARFANALVSTGVVPADLSWKAGVEVLSLGATKNGAVGCEAIILFDQMQEKYPELIARAKRAGHMPAKSRFLAAQMLAWLENGLWLKLAKKANMQAQALANILTGIEDSTLMHPVEGNEVFIKMPDMVAEFLIEQGVKFYPWNPGYRFVCAYLDITKELDELARLCQKL